MGNSINELLKYDKEDILKALEKKESEFIQFEELNDKNRIKNTLKNFQQLLDHYGITIKYNEMTKQNEITIPGHDYFADTAENAKMARLRSMANYQNFPVSEIDNYVIEVGNLNRYHPVRDWIDSVTWDGRDRLCDYYNSIELREHNPLKETMMRKWALSLVGALYHEDFSCEAVLSLVGDQGLGKTIWIENLIPTHAKNLWNKDAVVIDTKNKDSLIKALSYWIAELGEVSATFRKSDIEALKGFLTEKFDVIRNPYERKSNTYRRRTVFYATVNDTEFLQDDENRRFWVLDVVKLNHGTIDDCGQFWAQLKAIYMSIRDKLVDAQTREKHQEWGWFLSPNEKKLMSPLQEKHKNIEPVIETLEKYLEKPSTDGEWHSCTDILSATSWGRPTGRDTRIASKWLSKNGYERQSDTKKYRVKFQTIESENKNVVNLDEKLQQLRMKKGGLF